MSRAPYIYWYVCVFLLLYLTGYLPPVDCFVTIPNGDDRYPLAAWLVVLEVAQGQRGGERARARGGGCCTSKQRCSRCASEVYSACVCLYVWLREYTRTCALPPPCFLAYTAVVHIMYNIIRNDPCTMQLLWHWCVCVCVCG